MKLLRRVAPTLALLAALAGGLGAAPLDLEEIQNRAAGYRSLVEERDELLAELPVNERLNAYQREYYAALGAPRGEPVSPAETHQALAAARGVVMADYHLAPESQRRATEVLRAMASGGPVTLILEWIDHRYQREVDAFLAGQLDADTLRGRIHYDDHWPFPWENYLPVLEAARDVRARVVLSEDFTTKPQPSLWQRDERVVAALTAAADDGTRYLAIYGAFHVLGEGHLGEKLAAAGLPVDWVLTGEAPEVWFQALARHRDPDRLEYLALDAGRMFVRNGTPTERISGEIADLEWLLGY